MDPTGQGVHSLTVLSVLYSGCYYFIIVQGTIQGPHGAGTFRDTVAAATSSCEDVNSKFRWRNKF